MGITVEWFDASTKDIILVTYDPFWTWGDYRQAKQEVDTLLASTEANIYVINDHTNAPLLPIGNRSGSGEISTAFANAPTNIACVYTVGAPDIIRIILTGLQRLTLNRLLKNLVMTKTLDDALRMIRQKQRNSPSIS